MTTNLSNDQMAALGRILRKNRKERLVKALSWAAVAVVLVALVPWVFTWAWNEALSPTVAVPATMTYWRAVGVIFIAQCLMKVTVYTRKERS